MRSKEALWAAAFVLTRLAPGDATLSETWGESAEARAAARQRLGLDRPLPVQYAAWLAGALRLDFGESSLYARPVGGLLRERAVNTAILATAALLLAALLGVGAGVYTATYAGTWGARVTRALSVLFLSTPPLIVSLVLVLVAARTGWAPVGGMSSAGGATVWGSSDHPDHRFPSADQKPLLVCWMHFPASSAVAGCSGGGRWVTGCRLIAST